MNFRWALLLFSALLSVSCEKTVINRGYAVDAVDFSSIVIGKDTAQSVFEKVGSPTICSSVEEKRGGYNWYYISKKLEKSGFLEPEVVAQKNIIISFDTNGIVRDVKESSYEGEVETVKEETKTDGKGTGIINETFGGLGKYMKRYQNK